MAGKATSKPAGTTKPPKSEIEQKSWEMYLRLSESPSMAGKTQEHVLAIARERAEFFVNVSKGGS